MGECRAQRAECQRLLRWWCCHSRRFLLAALVLLTLPLALLAGSAGAAGLLIQ